MDKETLLGKLKGHLIVSCQALDYEPLHSSFIMGRMAIAAVEGGAVGIRANTPDSEVYITPTMEEIDAMVACGSDIIAMDATARIHPNGLTTDDLFAKAKKAYPNHVFMADCATLEECIHAQEIGFDIVGTTMRSYTEYTKGVRIPDFELFRQLKKSMDIPFIAEGGIWDPEEARLAIECGAFAVVVGSAITRPQIITRRYAKAVEGK